MFIYPGSHVRLLAGELGALIPAGSFASRVRHQLGAELHYRLVDWPIENEVEFSAIFPVEALFAWVSKSGMALDPEWLIHDDGFYHDDDGAIISASVTPDYSPVEQLAAYGLWLISTCIYSWGAPLEIDEAEEKRLYEEQGLLAKEVIEHRSACMLLAYQTLVYAQQVTRGDGPSEEDQKKFRQVDFSILGAKGAQKRHANMAKLQAWAIEKYRAGNWASGNRSAHRLAAHTLADEIIAYGRTMNAVLTPTNAQRTIAAWFREHDRTNVVSRHADTSSR